MSAITWTNERIALRDLTPWERNPRKIADAEAERLLESFDKFGQVQTIAIGPNNEIYDGHQRKSVIGAATKYGLDYEVDVRRASRELTEKEREQLTVLLHRGAAGDWDWDLLADWDYSDLTAWGFDADELDERFASSDENVWGEAVNGLPNEDRAPFQQMTFTLHDEQVEQVKRAIAAASRVGDFADSPNQNGNGNALALICETFMTSNGIS